MLCFKAIQFFVPPVKSRKCNIIKTSGNLANYCTIDMSNSIETAFTSATFGTIATDIVSRNGDFTTVGIGIAK